MCLMASTPPPTSAPLRGPYMRRVMRENKRRLRRRGFEQPLDRCPVLSLRRDSARKQANVRIFRVQRQRMCNGILCVGQIVGSCMHNRQGLVLVLVCLWCVCTQCNGSLERALSTLRMPCPQRGEPQVM